MKSAALDPITRWLAGSVLACGVLALLLWARSATDPVLGFGWWDTAFVQVLGAVPLAILLTSWPRPKPFDPAVAAVAATFGILLALGASLAGDDMPREVVRLTLALGTALTGVGVLAVLPAERRPSVPMLAATSLLGLVLGGAYLWERRDHHAQRFGELVDQSRFGEALELGRRLETVDPSASFRDTTISAVVGKLRDRVAELESVASREARTPEERRNRARTLAILGRFDEAREQLLRDDPDVSDMLLLGTIAEHGEHWDDCVRWHSLVVERLDDDPAADPARATALRGIGFAERKRGNHAAAERAYLRLVELTPTADVHFLVARFYAETQMADRARHHAEEAAIIDPLAYREPAKRMLDSMQSDQFGCFQVFSNRRTW